MKIKLALVALVILIAAGVGFQALGGIEWLGASGLLGEDRLVRSRMESYWTARLESDMGGMASYVHPMQREIVEPGLLQTESYEIHDVTVDGDEAIAKISFQSRLKHPMLSANTREITTESRWVKYDGKWYRELKPVGLNEVIQSYQGTWVPPTEKEEPSDAP